MENELKNCPFCAEDIKKEAIKCKHCGEIVDAEIRAARKQQASTLQIDKGSINTGLAAVLSFVLPGLGQIYKGSVGGGFLWMIITILGYCMVIIPGLLMHIACVIDAASDNSKKTTPK